MKAVTIDDWKAKPYVKDIPIPQPRDGQVLIKVESASINPADNAFLKGKYGAKRTPPCTPGLEGSGTVV